MNIKVSIIVPIFNTEKHIGVCLKSLLGQTYKNIEILCINDGSTDNSAAEIEKFLSDKRISLFNTQNNGVSAARNIGIEKSSGDYIMFVDSDDYLDYKTVEYCVNEASLSNCDIICFGIFEIKNGKKIERKDIEILKKFRKLNVSLNEVVEMHGNIWGKLFSSSFIKKHKLRFPEGIETCEDGIFCLCAATLNPSYSILDKYFYYYVIDRSDSCTNKDVVRNIKSDFKALKYLVENDFFSNSTDRLKVTMLNRVMSGINTYMSKIEYLDPATHKILRKQINTFCKKYIDPYILKKTNYNKYFGIAYRFKQIRRNLFDIRNSDDRRHKTIRLFAYSFNIKRLKHKIHWYSAKWQTEQLSLSLKPADLCGLYCFFGSRGEVNKA